MTTSTSTLKSKKLNLQVGAELKTQPTGRC